MTRSRGCGDVYKRQHLRCRGLLNAVREAEIAERCSEVSQTRDELRVAGSACENDERYGGGEEEGPSQSCAAAPLQIGIANATKVLLKAERERRCGNDGVEESMENQDVYKRQGFNPPRLGQ